MQKRTGDCVMGKKELDAIAELRDEIMGYSHAVLRIRYDMQGMPDEVARTSERVKSLCQHIERLTASLNTVREASIAILNASQEIGPLIPTIEVLQKQGLSLRAIGAIRELQKRGTGGAMYVNCITPDKLKHIRGVGRATMREVLEWKDVIMTSCDKTNHR